jgi:predicted small lipoprotein YifL
MRCFLLLTLCLAAALLAGCGNKGPLVLPPARPQPAAQPTAQPAPQPAPAATAPAPAVAASR